MSILARRYAEALFAAAEARGESRLVLGDLHKLRVAFTDPDSAAVLGDPATPRPSLLAALDKLLEGGSELSRNLVRVALRRHRQAVLGDLAEEFAGLLRDKAGEARAVIETARPLADEALQAIRTELARSTGKTIVAEVVVDPDLLAGVRVRVGNTLYDGSLQGELEALHRHLSNN